MAVTAFEDAPVWLITGSSQGLGKAILDGVLAAGLRAVATLRRPEVLDEYKEKYPAAQLLITRLDVADSERIVEVFEEVKGHFGRIDVVVNNAGYGIKGEIEVTPDSEARKLFEVLFWGTVNVSKQAVAFMRDVNPPGVGGRILNISSITGYSANPVIGFYSAAKFAVEGFTESLNKEMLPSWNIKAIIIEPGGFQTEWGKSSMLTLPVPPQYDSPEAPSMILRGMLHNEYIGDPVKAAKVLLVLAKESNPPMRLQLGTDCISVVKGKAQLTLRETEKWEELGHSTNLDGVSKEAVLEEFSKIIN